MANADGTLPPELRDRFLRDGYLVLPSFFDPAPILARAKQIVEEEFSLEGHPLTKFSTGGGGGDGAEEEGEEEEHVGDAYFLSSGDKVRFFLESDAVQNGALVLPPARSVNKVGHALAVLDPTFHALTFGERMQHVARSLGLHREPLVLQSMIICKQASIGGAVPEHNDSTFLYTDPPSAIGFWLALEDCTETNGCLSFQPGSHLHPPSARPSSDSSPTDSNSNAKSDGEPNAKPRRPRLIPPQDRARLGLGEERGVNRRFVRVRPGDEHAGTTFVEVARGEEARWGRVGGRQGEDGQGDGEGNGDEEAEAEAEARMEPCPAGTLVLIHGSVLHRSERNRSDRSRYIYTFHMIESEEHGARYDERNWLQPTARMPFSKLYAPPPAPSAPTYE